MTRSRQWLTLVAGILTTGLISAALPAEAFAQTRPVRRPVVRSFVVAPIVRPVFYRPFYYPYYSRLYPYGLSAWYGWPYYGYAQVYPYPRYYRDYTSSARLLVEPRNAEVFIDGYFVGLVDDFDGVFQRLNVAPGEHELAVFLDGYRTYRQNVLFRPGATVKIEHMMQQLQPGDPPEERPAPSASRGASQGAYPPPARRGNPVPAPRRGAPAPPQVSAQEYGSVSIRVQPVDAEVLVNGERWESPEAGVLILQLAEGTHRIEIRRDGFRSYSADVSVRRGETTTVNVSLSRQ